MTMPPKTPGFWYVNAVTEVSGNWQPMFWMTFACCAQLSGNWCSTPKYTRNPATAASAVEPSAFFAIPMDTPTQNSSGNPSEPSSSAP